jgi:protein-disulfide isomerase
LSHTSQGAPGREAEEGPAGRRRPRIGALIVIALALAALLALIASLSLDDPERVAVQIEGAGATQRLFGGIPQQGARLGSEAAPVAVSIFNDLQCAGCDDWHRRVVPPLVEGPVRGGEVSLEFRHFPITERGLASVGAIAAGEQGRQWQFINVFYLNQDDAQREGADEQFLRRIAAAVLELDVDQWAADLDGPEVIKTLDADTEAAAKLKIPGEPAAIVDGPGGTRQLIESPSLQQVEAAIAEVSES